MYLGLLCKERSSLCWPSEAIICSFDMHVCVLVSVFSFHLYINEEVEAAVILPHLTAFPTPTALQPAAGTEPMELHGATTEAVRTRHNLVSRSFFLLPPLWSCCHPWLQCSAGAALPFVADPFEITSKSFNSAQEQGIKRDVC